MTRIGVSSFIVTLAGMLYFRGISMIATNGATVAPLPRSLTGIATGFLPPALSIGVVMISLLAYGALRLAEIRRAAALGVSKGALSEALRALLPPLAAAVVAVWIVSWQGIPYLVLLVALCTFAAELVDAPDSLRRAALRDRRQSGGGPALRHQSSRVQSSGISSSPASATASPASR